MATKKKVITDCQILEAIRGIKKDLKEGYSLALSRKRNCGHTNNPLYRAVSTHPDYQPILLEYGKQKGHTNQYTKRAQKIVKGETPNFYKWVIENKAERFYQIHKLNSELIEPLQDLIISSDDESGMLQITSRAFTKSIFFKTSELMEEFNKFHLNQGCHNHVHVE